MKLIKKTYLYTAGWMIPLMLIGSVFVFYMIKYISYEDTDEYLIYEMKRLINNFNESNEVPDFDNGVEIIPGIRFDKPEFRDTLLLEPIENEMVPYRELYFSINHQGQNFTIVLRHLLLGRDDITKGTILIIIGLMFFVYLQMFFVVSRITGRIWKPFYITLDKLINYKSEDNPPDFPDTKIEEFNKLNDTLIILLRRIYSDFKHYKEFNENASHELQTHLAIIRANSEKLLNKSNIINDDESAGILQMLFSASTRLSQVQRSLLLLSRITNREFSNNSDINLCDLIRQSMETFSEALNIRKIIVEEKIEECWLYMDTGLAEILVNNLVKNAVKHNVQNGYIKIILNNETLIIENKGRPIFSKPENMMERFAKGQDGNFGIGLAIVKQICELYNFRITYEVTGKTIHSISVRFISR